MREQISWISEIDALMVVDALPFVVIFRTEQTRASGEGLRRFVGFEAAEQRLFAFSAGSISESSVAEHPGIVHLQIFRIDLADVIQRHEGVFVLSLEE